MSAQKKGEINVDALPDVLIEAARKNPTLWVHEFTAEDILRIAGENRGTFATDCSSATSVMSTHRAIVDGKGTIRFQKPVRLDEGTHILITTPDKDSLIAPMRSSVLTALSEERLRVELQEDEAWAYLLKNRPS